VIQEISAPSETIFEDLGVRPQAFAYPYGDANEFVIDQIRGADFAMAATVRAGGNPSFAYPFLLRRTMIFGEDDLEAFQKKLDVFHFANLK
jgi:hypothetical protein